MRRHTIRNPGSAPCWTAPWSANGGGVIHCATLSNFPDRRWQAMPDATRPGCWPTAPGPGSGDCAAAMEAPLVGNRGRAVVQVRRRFRNGVQTARRRCCKESRGTRSSPRRGRPRERSPIAGLERQRSRVALPEHGIRHAAGTRGGVVRHVLAAGWCRGWRRSRPGGRARTSAAPGPSSCSRSPRPSRASGWSRSLRSRPPPPNGMLTMTAMPRSAASGSRRCSASRSSIE